MPPSRRKRDSIGFDVAGMRGTSVGMRDLAKGEGDLDTGYEYGGTASDALPWYVINPDSKRMGAWDMVTGLVLIFVAAFTPFEVAFLSAPTKGDDTLFVLGRTIDGIFILDMCLCFFITFPSEFDPSKLETRLPVIMRGYLRGWFILDIVSLGSSSFDIIPLLMGSADGSKSPLTSFRVVRILRLAKLVRLFRASRKLREWSVHFALPRAVLTIISATFEVLYLIHLLACIFRLVAIIPSSELDTWLATHGYCNPIDWDGEEVLGAVDEPSSGESLEIEYECCEASYVYLQTIWWSGGGILGAPVSHSPLPGPYPPYYSRPDSPVKFTTMEQIVIICLKTFTAFFFLTVTARFVTVYNNLDPDQKAFNQGLDALNAFVSYFSLTKADARELRLFYVERVEEVKALTRKRTMNALSPFLAEKFVWKINKGWLMLVPCFGLVVERLRLRPDSGMERFLVKVAMAMLPATFCSKRETSSVAIVHYNRGEATYEGRKLGKGHSWGAADVLLKTRRQNGVRARAVTYLHVVYVGAAIFDGLMTEFREAFILCRFWTLLHAAGREVLANYRRQKKASWQIRLDHEGGITSAEVQHHVNVGNIAVDPIRGAGGLKQYSTDGHVLYNFKYSVLTLGKTHEIVLIKPGKERKGNTSDRLSPHAAK